MPDTGLISTKLHVPAPRRQLVERTRLADLLPHRPDVLPRLVLVAAPAGFGKTTLLTQWCSKERASGCRVAWVSVDSHDSDVRRLLTQLVTALRTDEGRDRSVGAVALQ